MRAFIAFKISEDAGRELGRIQMEIARRNPDVKIKWVNVNDAHITLEFLGDIADTQAEQVKSYLNTIIVQYKYFTFQLNKINAFPNLNSPNILTVEVKEQYGDVSFNLEEEIHNALAKIGLNLENKNWHPHITLGRVKSGPGGPIAVDNLSVQSISWEIKEVFFIKSELTPAGPIYQTIQSYKLHSS